MSVLVRSRLSGVALAAGVLAVVMLIGVWFVRPMQTQAWVYTAAFWVALVGLVLAAAGSLQERHERLSFKPRTHVGWWSVGLAAFGVLVLVGAGAILGLLRANGPGGPGGVGVPMFVFTIAGFASMVTAGVLALVAWFKAGERSWVVLLTTLPAVFAVYFVIGEFAFPH